MIFHFFQYKFSIIKSVSGKRKSNQHYKMHLASNHDERIASS